MNLKRYVWHDSKCWRIFSQFPISILWISYILHVKLKLGFTLLSNFSLNISVSGNYSEYEYVHQSSSKGPSYWYNKNKAKNIHVIKQLSFYYPLLWDGREVRLKWKGFLDKWRSCFQGRWLEVGTDLAFN